MKKFVRLLIFLAVLIAILGAAAYIDYFITKSKGTYPKIAISKKLSDEAVVYNAVFYRVWYCKTNNEYTIGSYADKDAICPHNYEYEDGYYTNALGIKISKKDLQLISSYDIYTTEMIDNMSSDAQVQSAVHVASEYIEKTKYQSVNKKSEDGEELIVFPEFVFDEETGNYSWKYNTEDESKYYCMSGNSFAKYDIEEEECGSFSKVKMDEEWCSSYELSTLVYENKIEQFCKE